MTARRVLSAASQLLGAARTSLLLLLLLLPATLAAEAHREPVEDSEVRRVLRAMSQAVGGPAWDEVEAIRLDGVRNRNGYEQSLTLWLAQPLRIRVEIGYRDQTEVFVYDGERARLDPFIGPLARFSERSAAERLDEVRRYLHWPGLWSQLEESRFVGSSERDGVAVDLLEVTPESGPVQRWRIESATGRLIEIVEERSDGEESWSVHTYRHELRPVGDVLLPFYVEIDEGTSLIAITWQEAVLDPVLERGLFTVAAE